MTLYECSSCKAVHDSSDGPCGQRATLATGDKPGWWRCKCRIEYGPNHHPPTVCLCLGCGMTPPPDPRDAELARLRAEVERLMVERDEALRHVEYQRDLDDTDDESEVAPLHAELARLRAQCEALADNCKRMGSDIHSLELERDSLRTALRDACAALQPFASQPGAALGEGGAK